MPVFVASSIGLGVRCSLDSSSAWAGRHTSSGLLEAGYCERPVIAASGDAVGPVSPLFGHYPKAGHVAIWHGRMSANHISALAKGKEMEPVAPT